MSVKVEVCVGSLSDCIAAVEGGAHRLELNSALELGGLTPSAGLTRQAVAMIAGSGRDIPLIAMARPRPAGFCYDEHAFATLIDDARSALEMGCAGVAFGVLLANGGVDMQRCGDLMKRFNGVDFVFHRAFDLTPDPRRALEQLIDLGVTRVMTSGQQVRAMEGAGLIAALIEQAAGRIEVLPAAGITAENVLQIVARTGCDQVHGSFSGESRDETTGAPPGVDFSVPGRRAGMYGSTLSDAVAAAVGRLARGDHAT